MTKKQKLLRRLKHLPRRTLIIGATVIVVGSVLATIYALQAPSRTPVKQALNVSSSSGSSSVPICVEGSAGCPTFGSNSTQQSTSSAPSQSPMSTPSTKSSAPATSSETTKSATPSCDKNGAGLALSQLSNGEEQEATQYAAVPLVATTESELITNNGTISQINIALNSDWQSYVNFMGALNAQ